MEMTTVPSEVMNPVMRQRARRRVRTQALIQVRAFKLRPTVIELTSAVCRTTTSVCLEGGARAAPGRYRCTDRRSGFGEHTFVREP